MSAVGHMCIMSGFGPRRPFASGGAPSRLATAGTHAERRGLMQISDGRYVLLFALQSHPRDVKTESAPNAVACEYVEPGATATDDRRAVFQQMIADATQPPAPFDAILEAERVRGPGHYRCRHLRAGGEAQGKL